MQFQRMPNISLLPGERDITLDDIVAATTRGIVIKNRGSWSIDHQRYNFQFSGQAFYEVRDGKIVGMLRDVAYQSNTPVFWNSMDMIGGKSSYWMGGSFSDGKGEPAQSSSVSHGCVPARFRNVTILNTRRTRMSLQDGSRSDDQRHGLLSREQAQALADRVLSFATGDDQTRVNISSEWGGNTRFADASITTSGGVTDTSVNVDGDDRQAPRVGVHQRAGRCLVEADGGAGGNARAAVAGGSRADAGARSADVRDRQRLRPAHRRPRSRNHGGGAISRAIEAANGGREGGRRRVHRRIPRGARARGGGRDEHRAVRLSPHDRRRLLDDGANARRTGSGWASGGSRDWGRWIRRRSAGSRREKAVASRNPQAIEPGSTRRCSSRQAVNDLVPLLAGALNARTADEGRSAFSKPGGGTRIGEKVVDERVTLYSDPADPALLGQPFDDEGLPLSRHRLDRERHPAESRPTRASGRRSRASSPTGPRAGRAASCSPGGTQDDRGADRRLRARHPRDALLLHPLARCRARCCRPA